MSEDPKPRDWAGWLYRRGENLLALMLATMFAAFLIQIGFRYLLHLPTGWTSELSALLWIWLVLFGAAFVTRESEEIRFDIFFAAAPPKVRRDDAGHIGIDPAGALRRIAAGRHQLCQLHEGRAYGVYENSRLTGLIPSTSSSRLP